MTRCEYDDAVLRLRVALPPLIAALITLLDATEPDVDREPEPPEHSDDDDVDLAPLPPRLRVTRRAAPAPRPRVARRDT